MKRFVPLAALALLALAAVPAQASKPSPYPKPNSFAISAPFSIGRVSLGESLVSGKDEWNGKPRCVFKKSFSECRWGGEKAAGGVAVMQADPEGDHIHLIFISLGEDRNGDSILNRNSPLTKFFTTRARISLMDLASKVPDVDPANIEEHVGGFSLPAKGTARMLFLTGGTPNNKFVNSIILTDVQ